MPLPRHSAGGAWLTATAITFRAERVEKNQERMQEQLNAKQKQLDTLTIDVTTMHATMKSLKENTDKLLVGLRDIIICIPPGNLS